MEIKPYGDQAHGDQAHGDQALTGLHGEVVWSVRKSPRGHFCSPQQMSYLHSTGTRFKASGTTVESGMVEACWQSMLGFGGSIVRCGIALLSKA